MTELSQIFITVYFVILRIPQHLPNTISTKTEFDQLHDCSTGLSKMALILHLCALLFYLVFHCNMSIDIHYIAQL